MSATKKGSTRTRASDAPGREAGFREGSRRALEKLAARELEGVLEAPKLLSDVGLWVTLLAREPCCGARVLLNIRPRESLDDESYEDLVRAAVENRDVQDPTVLPVRRFGRTDELVWVTTRAYRGRLLGHTLAPDSTRPMASVLGFLRQVAGPLEAVHRAGLVHGALDSGSFHRDTEGRIRVRNLGIDVPVLRASLRDGAETEAGACAAPEVRAGAPATAESDQYALAALLLRALTGRSLATDGRRDESGTPVDVRPLFRRALHRDPDERFDSVIDFWSALDAVRFGPEREPPREERAAAPRRSAEERSAAAGRRPGPSPLTDTSLPGDSGYVTSAFRRRKGRRDLGPEGPAPRPERGWGPARRDDADPYGSGWPDGDEPPLAESFDRQGPFDPDDPHAMAPEAWWRERHSSGGGVWGRGLAAAVVLLLFSGAVELLTRDPVTPSGEGEPVTAEADRATSGAGASSRPESDTPVAGGDHLALSPESTEATNMAPRSGQAEVANTPAASVEDPAAVPPADSPSTDRTSVGSERVSSPSVTATEPPPTRPEPSSSASPASQGDSPVASASEPGRLFLQSYPWAEVYVDGSYLGNSPIVDVRISSGSHTIRVERNGYEPYLVEVDVQPGEDLRLTGIVLTERGS